MNGLERKRVAVVGAGRLGGALSRAWQRSGLSVALLARPRSAEEEASMRAIVSASEVIFLCVPDAKIAEVARGLSSAFRKDQLVAHCSGALDLSPIEPARARGARTGGLHPLCAVATPTSPLSGAAALSGERDVIPELDALARSAGLSPFELPLERRPLYHAAAALASNGLIALADQAAGLLSTCGLGRGEALDALLPLMRSALAGLESAGLPGALTGPIARGDDGVVRRHLAALDGTEPADTYRAISRHLLILARALGEADAGAILRIESALSDGSEEKTEPAHAPLP